MRAVVRGRRTATGRAGLTVLVWAIGLVCFGRATSARADGQPLVTGVESIGVTVGDLDRSVAFFRDVLMFELISQREESGEAHERLDGVFGLRKRVARMRLGTEFIELTEYFAPRGRAMPPDSRGNDQWFQHIAIVVSDMGKAYERLREHRVSHASTGPQRLPDSNPNAGGIRAFYFRDPDDHFLELIQFPAGRGDPRWQQGGDALFLGIDHTAIVVRDTEASLKFYRDELGMRVAGASENFGDEQEHLNNVFGARLRITALRAASGPGVELLEYLAPSDGRPSPVDSRPCDLWHWSIQMRAADARSVESTCIRSRRTLISSRTIDLSEGESDFSASIQIRDPDGHALQFISGNAARSEKTKTTGATSPGARPVAARPTR